MSCVAAHVLRHHAQSLYMGRRGATHATLRDIAAELWTPFMINATEDTKMKPVVPTLTNFRPPMASFMHAYVRAVLRASVKSEVVWGTYLKVAHLEAGPDALFQPSVVLRLLVFGW